MMNLSFQPPEIIEASVLTRVPDALRAPRPNDWARANKPGELIDSFLEGPCFDRDGNLFLTDVPYGRIFKVAPDLSWSLVAQYRGWPNGMAVHADGSLWITDYRLGLLRIAPGASQPESLLGHRNSESFRGLNDLTFDRDGNLYLTDQGQTGLHDPTGRVYRLRTNGALDLLLSNGPSPNGIALSPDGRFLLVAMTRANAVWRGPLLADGSISKVGQFQSFFGASGPDGMAVDELGRVVVCHASLGGAFVLSPRGEITHFIHSPAGNTITNVAYRPGSSQVVLTDSETGSVLTATLPSPGAPLYSHH